MKDKQNGNTKELPVEGVFVEIGSLPATNYLKGLVRLNKQGEVTIDSANKTSASGIYAAGDITDVPEKQIIIAAGEGAKAAIQAAKFLARQD